ncbi:MAG: methylenetetrahydrofolate reductase [bacterium]
MLRDTLSKQKIITLEVLLPNSLKLNELAGKIKPFKGYIDAINIPSNPLGRLRPDALCCAHVLQHKTGIEMIPHFVARHFTSLGFESHLLGAAALDITNVLCVTGDTPNEGRSGFELNSSKLLDIAKKIQQGVTSARKAINPVDFCLCTSFNPNVPNIQGEFMKSKDKYKYGAECFFTQPVFNPIRFIEIAEQFRQRFDKAKLIAGLSFLHTKKRAFALMKFLGIPYEYINNIEEKDESNMLFETAMQLKDYVDGFYIIPITKYAKALDFVKKIRKML